MPGCSLQYGLRIQIQYRSVLHASPQQQHLTCSPVVLLPVAPIALPSGSGAAAEVPMPQSCIVKGECAGVHFKHSLLKLLHLHCAGTGQHAAACRPHTGSHANAQGSSSSKCTSSFRPGAYCCRSGSLASGQQQCMELLPWPCVALALLLASLLAQVHKPQCTL